MKMATEDNSYRRLMAEFRKHDNYDAVFRSSMDDLAGKVDFSWVKSCIAFGVGSGEHELLFARRALPNLREFIAVEPDSDSVKALRSNLRDGQLPGVQATVCETTVQDWKGVEHPVDAVLLFNFLLHVNPENRRGLLDKLMNEILNPGGILVVVDSAGSEVSDGYLCVLQRLGLSGYLYSAMEEDIMATGFRRVFTQDIRAKRDLSNASDDAVKFLQLLVNYKCSLEQIRAMIDQVFSQSDMTCHLKKLEIFSSNHYQSSK